MKYLLSIAVLILLAACSKEEITYTQQEVQCTTTEVGQRILVECPNGMNYQFDAPRDGIDGVNGLNGTNGNDAQGITVIDPCGDMVASVDEILLVFPDGRVLAWYQNVGLTLLTPGTVYQTTDAQACVFTVNSNGSIN